MSAENTNTNNLEWPGNSSITTEDTSDSFRDQLQYLSDMIQQQTPQTYTGNPTTTGSIPFDLLERLDKLEESLKTILNMLKLIFGAQLDREKEQKEKEIMKNCHNTKL
jgi:hypothetical protein